MNNLIFYKQQFNLANATFIPIEHEEAMVAIVYKVTFAKGISFILKICPRAEDYWREVYFLNFLADLLPVAKIIQAEPPTASNYGAILMECFSGNLLNKNDITHKISHEAGMLLASLHLNRVNQFGDLTQKHSLSPDPRTPFEHKFEESFSECSNNLPKELIEKSWQYYKTHVDALNLVDGACLIHRDFRPGNIIFLDDKITGIIDWASARASFAEDDFSPLELGEWPKDVKLKNSFLNGYASIRPIPEYKLIMPLLLMNRAFATIGFTVKKGTWNNTHASIYQANFEYLVDFIKNQ
ncbi:MAG: aminoglycoside phosphotransferase family protein [Gammaproteobacteria bacterium]|nr:aminoglycoside phosphotransferase family protein [Gammaproteobacteria bacterium]